MPLPAWLIPALATGGGFLGELFSKDYEADRRNRELMRTLGQEARFGPDVNKLAAPALGALNAQMAQAQLNANKAVGQQGLSNTSIAGQIPMQLFSKKASATSGIYAQATAQQQAAKERARWALMQLLGMQKSASPGLGALTGAGIQGLMRSFLNSGTANTGGGTNTELDWSGKTAGNDYYNPSGNYSKFDFTKFLRG